MSFSYGAARNFVPLLSRLVLAAAFVPAGWLKIMAEERVFEGRDAQILKDMGVGEPVTDDLASLDGLPGILASYQYQEVETGSLRPGRQEEEEEPAEEEAAEEPQPPAGEPEVPQAQEPDPVIEQPPAQPQPTPRVEVIAPPEPQPNRAEETPQGERVRAKQLYSVAIMLHERKWPKVLRPDLMAWAAAGTELVGGALILVGLFGRLCGLGLAVVMGFAFYMTSLGPISIHGFLELPISDFNQVFTQLGLFVLAFGVMLTGAGGFSLDWLLFKRGGEFGFEQHDEVIDL